MKFRLVEDIALEEDVLNENDWWTVPFTDNNSGLSDEVSLYASSAADASDLFNQLATSVPDKRGNYLSKTRRQKFHPLIAQMISGGSYTVGVPYLPTGTPVNKTTIEDKPLRTKSKNQMYNTFGTPKNALLHHKDGDEDNDTPENIVSVESNDNWINNVFHKILGDNNFNTTIPGTRMNVTKLPLTISFPIKEYTSGGRTVVHTGIIEIR